MTTLTTLGVLAQAAGQVGSGRIQGGWGYVWACYGITVAALVLYSLSLWLRRPQASQDAKE
ncbi:heme exporter protein CcmD [Myxococcus sp. MISCRS1]|jgi:hypothetical protein|uniref:heme exporter protein CcmD n=1 Tax=Myxococcus TaxID=32 RepID=UPI001141CFE3|nr:MULTISPECIES: heme exporter protein CcmD [unclassified Myxococcus]MBZ4401033.1 heme exporter protein CcmD [Myxococcus sp. AS-1-15]MBZ4409596.1 heme exporter protein CcmD [Myxococcus sp. XM-1-1-1]MCY1003144.1 heme exporter protein CcmD [Myxococcus sp. MISCRS1]BDT35275.1 heme exporter protein CcmD [Myxococcus sp. MH1]